ncbi:unnamed protein product [Lactuca virosa]|uniref:Uncharacterized protein n=1 Tax=Lactuca virosa TaxID=75947 RepID=A0AAU9LYZ9_9ASTR|nr:unnamed protein product [Lactuca virosa]
MRSSSTTLTRTKLISRDNAFGNDSDEYVSESIGIMANIFFRPRITQQISTSQKPLTKPTTYSSNSTNRVSKEHKSTVGTGCSSSNLKLLEAKVDLVTP